MSLQSPGTQSPTPQCSYPPSSSYPVNAVSTPRLPTPSHAPSPLAEPFPTHLQAPRPPNILLPGSAPAHLALLQTCHTPHSLLTKFTPVCSRSFTRGSFQTHQLSLPPAANQLGDSVSRAWDAACSAEGETCSRQGRLLGRGGLEAGFEGSLDWVKRGKAGGYFRDEKRMKTQKSLAWIQDYRGQATGQHWEQGGGGVWEAQQGPDWGRAPSPYGSSTVTGWRTHRRACRGGRMSSLED